MSWFNFYWRKQDIELLRIWLNNRGKNFRYVDETKADVDADDDPLPIPLLIETDRPVRFNPSRPRKPNKRIPFTAQERRDILTIKGKECNRCSHKRTLEIHHIDGDSSNNTLANLEILCHECHITLKHVH